MSPFNFKGKIKLTGNAVFKKIVKTSVESFNFVKASISNKTIFTSKLTEIVLELQDLFPYASQFGWKLAHQFKLPVYLEEQYFYQDSNFTVPATEIGDPIGGVKSLNESINLTQPSTAARPILNDGYFLFNGSSQFFQAGVNTDWTFLHQANTGVTILVKVEDESLGLNLLSSYIGTSSTSSRIGMFFIYENRSIVGSPNALRLTLFPGGNVYSASIGSLTSEPHVFGVAYNQTKISFYIDGQKISEQNWSPSTSSSNTPGPLEIGKIAGFNSGLFNGKFYKLFITDEILADTDIETISNSMLEENNNN
jgi:hypothetical protein